MQSYDDQFNMVTNDVDLLSNLYNPKTKMFLVLSLRNLLKPGVKWRMKM